MEPSSSSCHVTEIKHDIFISFRGKDIRKGLLSHLKKELARRHLDIYVDDRLERGDEISLSLFRAIDESQILLVVFSKDYASSKWCLQELAKMVECMERNNRVLLPVFFNVDPRHVRNQLGEYGDALAKHEETLKGNMLLQVQNWRSALNKAGHLSGFHYPTQFEDESELVDKIVEDILEKLSKFGPSESNGLVGIDGNISQIQSLLLRETSEVRFIGIWGMGGIGKTTIARAIFYEYSLQYDGCCIMNVREELERQGLSHLRERLISDLVALEKEGLHTSGIDKARYIKSAIRRLTRKKVFIVLDDVKTSEQLKKLVREGINFGSGSRVIITSRDREVFTSGVHEIYEVKKMDRPDSLKLFCLNAFNQCLPKMGYEKLSDEVLDIAQGNPLALEILGSYFHYMSSTDTWRCALNKIKNSPHPEIQRVLRFSYDELHDFEKKAFLDIAFFLNKEDKDYVIRLLNSWGFYGSSGIEVLQQKALITISNDNRIQMHDLIREMGLDIVRQESPDRERRSRLREIEDVYHVLRNSLGNNEVEAMQIDVKPQFADLLPLNVDTLKKMPRLRLLKFNYPLHAELCTWASHVKALLQDFVDSKGRELNEFNMLVKCADSSLRDEFDLVDKIMEDKNAFLPFVQFSNEKDRDDAISHLDAMGLEIVCNNGCKRLKDIDGLRRNDLGTIEVAAMPLPLNVDTFEKLRFLEFNNGLNTEVSSSSRDVRALLQDMEVSKRRDEPILPLEEQVALLLSENEEVNVASEIHIKCLQYFVIDGWSPEEFSVTSKDTKQLSITHGQEAGMEILNSSIGYLSNTEGSDVDDKPFKNLPQDLLCMRFTDYLKLSTSTGHEQDDTQKPKLHILFDGLKVYKGIVSFYQRFHDVVYFHLGVLSLTELVSVPQSIIRVLPWYGEFRVEKRHAGILLKILPPGHIVRTSIFPRYITIRQAFYLKNMEMV